MTPGPKKVRPGALLELDAPTAIGDTEKFVLVMVIGTLPGSAAQGTYPIRPVLVLRRSGQGVTVVARAGLNERPWRDVVGGDRREERGG